MCHLCPPGAVSLIMPVRYSIGDYAWKQKVGQGKDGNIMLGWICILL